MSLEESIEAERQKLRGFLTKKELRSKAAKNPITRESIIQRYHRLHYLERYPFGVPENLIQLNKSVAIIRAQSSQ